MDVLAAHLATGGSLVLQQPATSMKFARFYSFLDQISSNFFHKSLKEKNWASTFSWIATNLPKSQGCSKFDQKLQTSSVFL